MTLLYDLTFLLFSIVYLPYLVFTARFHKDFWQRLGIFPKEMINQLGKRNIIWVHAVSVGEIMAARLFCEAILTKFPQKRLVISTITKTGNDLGKRFFKDRATILYLPVDISYVVNKVLDRIRPQLFIIVETEIWPNLITALHKRTIPVALVNGRISPKSYLNYMKVRFLIKGILDKITLFCMQNIEYAERIKKIGAPPDRVMVTGNMKFDVASMISSKLDVEAIRNDLNLQKDQPLFIAGSTHHPEESIILKVYKDLLKDFPNLRLLLAPRHIERVSEIENLVRKFGFTPIRTSNITIYDIRNTNGSTGSPSLEPSRAKSREYEAPVLILDTMGRLNQLFSIATIVFMGGSLIRKGGQNILEPATFSKPIIFGPYMFNFKDIAGIFLKEDAAYMVKDEKELLKISQMLLGDLYKREELGNRARLLIEKNKGATQSNVEEITKLLEARETQER